MTEPRLQCRPPNKRMHTNRRHASQSRSSEFFGRWMYCRRTLPAAVGDPCRTADGCRRPPAEDVTRQQETVMKTRALLKRAMAHPYFSLFCAISVLFILPRYGSVVTMVGSAAVLSAYIAALPGSFRGRSGSLTLAKCLVAAIWALAVVVMALSLLGELQA